MFIQEIRLKTGDLATQRTFYAHTLDFPVLAEGDDCVTFKAGRSRLTFEATREPLAGIYHFAFNIPQNQLAEARTWLDTRIARTTDVFDFPSWNAHAIYFADPEGNIVEFIARHDLPNTMLLPFAGRNIIEISEIGLAVPDVPAAADTLHETLGIDVFKNTVSEAFAALGDGYGLFILVREGRIWLASEDVPARIVPLAVTVADAPESYRFPDLPYTITAGERAFQ